MGNNLCKERINKASDSKSPIDRILGRCAQVTFFFFYFIHSFSIRPFVLDGHFHPLKISVWMYRYYSEWNPKLTQVIRSSIPEDLHPLLAETKEFQTSIHSMSVHHLTFVRSSFQVQHRYFADVSTEYYQLHPI